MRKMAINKLNDLFGTMQSNEPETGFIAAFFKVFEKAIAPIVLTWLNWLQPQVQPTLREINELPRPFVYLSSVSLAV